jgi:hypothetical protein
VLSQEFFCVVVGVVFFVAIVHCLDIRDCFGLKLGKLIRADKWSWQIWDKNAIFVNGTVSLGPKASIDLSCTTSVSCRRVLSSVGPMKFSRFPFLLVRFACRGTRSWSSIGVLGSSALFSSFFTSHFIWAIVYALRSSLALIVSMIVLTRLVITGPSSPLFVLFWNILICQLDLLFRFSA